MAAGLGFKTFTTGEVLTAADTNGYLMQGILVFATEAARNSAITSPQEGQFAFTKDTNSLWYYSGSAWVASGATGDIEGVTAGVGITGGGTSGTVTITNDMATTITAAGDIVVGTGSGTYDNLPIGTTNQILTADTTVSPYKVKWATAAAGGAFTLLETGTLTGASVTTASLSQAYTDLYIQVIDYKPATDAARLRIRPNGVSAANSYTQGNSAGYTTLAFDETYIGISLDADNTVVSNLCTISIPAYANTTTFKIVTCNAAVVNATTTTSVSMSNFITGVTKAVSAITTIQFLPSTGNFKSGTYNVYGVK